MVGNTGETDPRYVVEIGRERFDPKEHASRSRRRVSAGRKKLAKALGVEVTELRGTDREAWLVQFAEDPDWATMRQFLELHGLGLTRRISSRVFLERIDRDKAAEVRRDPSVRAVTPYSPDMKIQTKGPQVRAPGSRFEIGLIEGDDLPAVADTLKALGLNVLRANADAHVGVESSFLIETTQSLDLSLVAAIDDVAWIAPLGYSIPQNFDTSAVVQSGNGVDHPVWDKGLDGEGEIIGVIDVGRIDRRSMFFEGRLGPEFGTPTHRKVVRDHSNAPFPPAKAFPEQKMDQVAHATRVCGCVAADAFDNPGNDLNRGGAYAAKLAYADSRLFTGDTVVSSLRDELEGNAAAGARVHSNSWILEPEDPADSSLAYDVRAAATDLFLWSNEDHLVVTTAPNPKVKNFIGGPMVAKNPITVGGVKASPDQNKRRADPLPLTADGRRKPDLLAVADGVITCDLVPDDGSDELAIVKTPVGGNSFATPHVAAAAALVRRYFVEGWYPNGKNEGRKRSITPSGALLKAMLLNATVPLTGQPYPSTRDGWGRLELNQTLHLEGDRLCLWIQDVRRPEGLVEDQTFSLKVPTSAESMKITLVFNDQFALPGSVDPVINKVDIEVREPKPSHFGYLGNDLLTSPQPQSRRRDFNFPPDVVADPVELKNNVRQVLVLAPPAGRWTIVVRAHHLKPIKGTPSMEPPLGSQGYALVASIKRA
jgi:hypothetical protein